MAVSVVEDLLNELRKAIQSNIVNNADGGIFVGGWKDG